MDGWAPIATCLSSRPWDPPGPVTISFFKAFLMPPGVGGEDHLSAAKSVLYWPSQEPLSLLGIFRPQQGQSRISSGADTGPQSPDRLMTKVHQGSKRPGPLASICLAWWYCPHPNLARRECEGFIIEQGLSPQSEPSRNSSTGKYGAL